MEIRHIYYKTEDAAYTISYVLTRKQVKYINLRIKSNGEVAVSAHRRVPATYVDKFVESKAPFILEALERVEKRREETGDRPHNYETGEIFRLLGRDYTLVVEEAGAAGETLFLTGENAEAGAAGETFSQTGREEIFFRGDSLVLRTKWPDHYPHKKNMMEKWMRFFTRKTFSEIIDWAYPQFVPHGAPYPVWTVRTMTSRWGSCQPQTGKITLNSKLIFYPKEAIEYVVVHEFAHFAHPDHSRAFWALVAEIMPDYKERKKLLNS